MNYLDLFHGIGGFALGAYWAGFKAENHFCSDIEPYAQYLYKKRFPASMQLGDITKINWQEIKKNNPGEWVISGGFPCQDISVAGKGKGLIDEETGEKTRSGLWYDYCEGIRVLRPRYAIMENVAALYARGLDAVLGSLSKIGYDAVWTTISAKEMGAPHKRERVWIIAYPNNYGSHGAKNGQSYKKGNDSNEAGAVKLGKPTGPSIQGNTSSYPNSSQCKGNKRTKRSEQERANTSIQNESFTENARCKHGESWGEIAERLQGQFAEWNTCNKSERPVEARNGCEIRAGANRVDDGVSSELDRHQSKYVGKPNRAERLKGCGNAILPQISELIFRTILK